MDPDVTPVRGVTGGTPTLLMKLFHTSVHACLRTFLKETSYTQHKDLSWVYE